MNLMNKIVSSSYNWEFTRKKEPPLFPFSAFPKDVGNDGPWVLIRTRHCAKCHNHPKSLLLANASILKMGKLRFREASWTPKTPREEWSWNLNMLHESILVPVTIWMMPCLSLGDLNQGRLHFVPMCVKITSVFLWPQMCAQSAQAPISSIEG